MIERSIEEFEKLKSGFTGKFSAEKQLFIKKLGQHCIENTISLIKHYKPKYWYIENPASSLMWFYIRNNLKFDKGFINRCSYGAYGYKITKLTCFYSNVKIELLQNRISPPYTKVFEKISMNEYKKIKQTSKRKTVILRNGVPYYIWYFLDNGEKTWCPKDAGLGQLQIKMNFNHQQDKKNTTKQLSEATMASSIPANALHAIFKEFK